MGNLFSNLGGSGVMGSVMNMFGFGGGGMGAGGMGADPDDDDEDDEEEYVQQQQRQQPALTPPPPARTSAAPPATTMKGPDVSDVIRLVQGDAFDEGTKRQAIDLASNASGSDIAAVNDLLGVGAAPKPPPAGEGTKAPEKRGGGGGKRGTTGGGKKMVIE